MIKDNPVKTTLPLVAAFVWFFQDLSDFIISQLLRALGPEAADALGVSMRALSLALVTTGAYVLGQWIQRNLTEPKGVLDEIIATMVGDPDVETSDYAHGRVREGLGDDPFVPPPPPGTVS